MIQILTGKLGAGKTLYASMLAFEAMVEGRTVLTNIDLVFSEMAALARRTHRVELDPRQLVKLDPAHDRNWQNSICWGIQSAFVEVILDEIHLFFNSREWATTSKECGGLYSFLTQSRKAAVNVTFIAQEESTIDKQFRVQAEWITDIVNSSHLPLGPLGSLPFKFFLVVKKDAKNGYVLSRRMKPYDRRFFRLYNSFAFLDVHMRELAAKVEIVQPYKLRRVPLWRWILEPIGRAFTWLRSATRRTLQFYSPAK